MARIQRKTLAKTEAPPPQPPPVDDDMPFLPNHLSLDTMSQQDLSQFAMRAFGRRLDETKPLPEQATQVKQWVRGNPNYVR